ncbi:MAG TPA: pseudouridine synthase [Planctomycetota bacterium]|nr:pseudouridine synthase [Planctomycetota bacterium]
MRTPRTIALNKPYGHVSQFTPKGGHPGLAPLVQVPSVYPVGRLDHDSEGLLLLTDSGPLAHRLTDPRFEHPRTYWAQVERVPTPEALARLREGVVIEGQKTRPAQARLLDAEPTLWPRNPPIRFRKNVPTAWIELVLREGRNRQVRKMTAAVGFPTLRLVRVAMGAVSVTGLLPGEWRDLTPEELARLEREARSQKPEARSRRDTL